MHPRGSIGSWRALAGRIMLAATALTLTALVVACGGGSSGTQAAKSASKTKIVACGTAKTAANVPIHIEVTAGQVSCSTAMTIEHKYAEAIRSGKVPGNGGGAPVKINGWTCQGYATPVVLHTGKASLCAEGASRILAVLQTAA